MVRARTIRPAGFHGGREVVIWSPKLKRNLRFELELSSEFDRFNFNEGLAAAFARQDDLEGALTPLPQCSQSDPLQGMRGQKTRGRIVSRKGQAYPIVSVTTSEFEGQGTHNWPVEAKRKPRGQ